jgi:lipoate-protein ligase A
MFLFDLTLETPAENVALDEALLEQSEAGEETWECLRLWESPRPMVVVGRSSQASVEVDLDACRRREIAVVRRTSGGAAIVAARGCLMYALVLDYRSRPELRSLDVAHRFVLESTLAALRPLVPGIARRGTSDLAIGDLKFSGNSVRCKRNTLLYHGTILYAFDLSLIGELLPMPPRQPDYRHGRPHGAFVTNLPASRQAIREALIAGWQAEAATIDWPRERLRELVERRYANDEWNFQR